MTKHYLLETLSNLKVMVVGGHPTLHNTIKTTLNDKKIDWRFIAPNEKARIAEFRRMVDKVDCVIEITAYASHSFQQIVKDAKDLGILVGSCNKKGITEFEKILANLSEEMIRRESETKQ